ncbi:MAG TPA: metallophosphoesterase [Acidobacteriota bacterium]|nr:metallophosphoesterase [Acidobacteriota bacterium]
MKLAITSDTHFGDPMCTLVKNDHTGQPILGPKYLEFRERVGQDNDFLILVGDILDFSLASYQEVYQAAKVFFVQIQKDRIARSVVYVPGNHDFDIWHTVEHEVNVIYQIRNELPPRRFRMSVPAVFDLRTKPACPVFSLPGVTRRSPTAPFPYGGLFLDQITVPEEREINFVFAYPNVYLVTDDESVLITHGQYLEPYWSMTREWAQRILGEDLSSDPIPTLHDLVALNFPLCQLACAGVGQAGPLTKVIQQIQQDVKKNRVDNVKKYLNRLDNALDEEVFRFKGISGPIKEGLSDLLCNQVKKQIISELERSRDTRYRTDFPSSEDEERRFWTFMKASVREIEQLNLEHGCNIPRPTAVIFGHTHRPIAWGSETHLAPAPPTIPEGRPIPLFNTGGWLDRDDGKGGIEFCGAEIISYADGRFNSERVG